MDKCQVLTAAGRPCSLPDLGRGLCHVHDPDGLYARQHPKSRAKLLGRADVQGFLAATFVQVREEHCATCRCVSTRLSAAG